MTHKELVERAGRWLFNTKQLNPVFTEKGSQSTIEFPDAIGWNCHHSIIVECKASFQDYLVDSNKPFRKWHELGMGNRRYYMCEDGVISPNRLMGTAFGLLYCKGRIVKIIKESEVFTPNLNAERLFLRSRILNRQTGDVDEWEGFQK